MANFEHRLRPCSGESAVALPIHRLAFFEPGEHLPSNFFDRIASVPILLVSKASVRGEKADAMANGRD